MHYYLPGSEWERRAEVLDTPYVPPAPHSLVSEFVYLWRILKAAPRARAFLLDCSSGRIYPDVLACAIVGLLPRSMRPPIALVGPMWQPNRRLRHLVERIVIRLADRGTTLYGVLATEDLTLFPATWGIDPAKVRRVPYFHTFKDEDLAEPEPEPGDHVFAGGNTQRDYAPLIEAARRMPEQRFVLATRLLDGARDVPPNVEARQVPHRDFVRLLRSARIVVVPMHANMTRSAGQQTYLNAMRLGKPTVISDAPGVRDYVTHDHSALICPSSANGYETALRRLLDPANASFVAALRIAAAEAASRFDYENHVRSLLLLMNEVLRHDGV
jgi:glycosyltransferase involved in cell wall biosynthesis